MRNWSARDIIGSQDFMPFVPLPGPLFFFILLNNLFGSIPFIQFPTFSRAGPRLRARRALVGHLQLRGHPHAGFGGYLKLQSVPGGITGPILV